MSVWTFGHSQSHFEPTVGSTAWIAGALKRCLTDRYRRLLAVAIMTIVGEVVVLQIHASRVSAVPQRHSFQSVIIHPDQASAGTLTLASAEKTDKYSVELILPRTSAALTHGVAGGDIRQHLSVTVLQANHPAMTVPSTTPPTATKSGDTQLSDIKLCDFHPERSGSVTIGYKLDSGLPWPDQLRIGVRHITPAVPSALRNLARTTQPYSFGLSFLLTFSSLCLCWRQMNS